MAESIRVFIYGTLKRDFVNFHKIMGDATFLSVVTTQIRYPLIIAGKWNSPMLIEEPGFGYQVNGELFEVSPALALPPRRVRRDTSGKWILQKNNKRSSGRPYQFG